jgi:hypothetical protein
METAIVLAQAMGRTLVLPPSKRCTCSQTTRSTRTIDSISEEHPGVEVISMEEFIQREMMTGT